MFKLIKLVVFNTFSLNLMPKGVCLQLRHICGPHSASRWGFLLSLCIAGTAFERSELSHFYYNLKSKAHESR